MKNRSLKFIATALDKADHKEATRKQHPEDTANAIKAIDEGEVNATGFTQDYADLMVRLISVYPDDAAHEALTSLREEFWGGQWKPTEGKSR